MRRTRAKATRDENEEDFEDVPSFFSFMVSSGDNNNNNNNNNNRRMNRKERRRLLGERKKQTSENEEEEDDKDDESNKVKERMIEMTRSSSEENNSKLEPRGAAAEKTMLSRSDDATAEPEVVLVTTDDMQQEGWAFTFPKSVNELSDTYQSAPARYKLMVCCACAFVVCNMDKINMSVAVIPMSREFSWDTAQSGILQSSFFYGFALSQIPGGFLNTKFGGARVLPLGLTFISLATLAIPLAGDNLPCVVFRESFSWFG
jgi:hypothetical protein